eukprot:CAMPEP_0184693588 /NCGR_PEP_ID=MMETSP0313-20130426/1767_1 /TAXON_ID=2792 /ORGANISM="Porphyridium aerugineum, Strain SAG 1380-2" /LENGTH=247 /DNA_ID=CAMNT_0027151695 /DNA_START=35 /DNA_END=778 /DNA_ORIENTATION=+
MALLQDLKTAWQTQDVEHIDRLLSQRRSTKLVKTTVDQLDSEIAMELCVALCRRIRMEGSTGSGVYENHEREKESSIRDKSKTDIQRQGGSEDLKMFSLWLKSILLRFREVILAKLLENLEPSEDAFKKQGSGDRSNKALEASLQDELRLLSIDVHNRAAVETSLNKLEGRLDVLVYQLALDQEIQLVSSEKLLSAVDGSDDDDDDDEENSSAIGSSDAAEEEDLLDESLDGNEERGFSSDSESERT